MRLESGHDEADIVMTYRVGIGYDVWYAWRCTWVVGGRWGRREAYCRLRYALVTAKHWRRRSWWNAWAAEAADSRGGAGGWTEKRAVANLRRELNGPQS